MQSPQKASSDLLAEPNATTGKPLLSRVEDSLLPLINLVFLLLMFFVAVGQISATPVPELPDTPIDGTSEKPEADLIIDADQWIVAGNPVTQATLLDALADAKPEQPLRIAAQRNASMRQMEALFRQLERGGYTDVVLLVQPAL